MGRKVCPEVDGRVLAHGESQMPPSVLKIMVDGGITADSSGVELLWFAVTFSLRSGGGEPKRTPLPISVPQK